MQETIQQPESGAAVRSSDWLGRIVCGDNTEVLSGFPDACIDLVVTSPPYDDILEYGGHSWDFSTLSEQLVRVMKPGGVIVWNVADSTVDGSETGTSMEQALGFKRLGMKIHDTMIYEKAGMSKASTNRYHQTWEYMFVLSKGAPPKTFNALKDRKNKYVGTLGGNAVGGKATREEYGMRFNVWRYANGKNHNARWDDAAREHPAIMPHQLAKDHITSWSNPGDVVLDPFCGSGTTCRAAKDLNREWVGVEVNPDYCRIAETCLSQSVLQLETCAMRPNSVLPKQ
jgi:site-specific DNA-methyltransferase (adenine-specific)